MDWENVTDDEKKRLAQELLKEAQTFRKKKKIDTYKEILKNFVDVIKLALEENSNLSLSAALNLINKKTNSTIDRSTLYQFLRENNLRKVDLKNSEAEDNAVKKVRKKLSEEEVFNFKEAHPEMTNEEIAEHFNVSSRTIRKKLQSFKN